MFVVEEITQIYAQHALFSRVCHSFVPDAITISGSVPPAMILCVLYHTGLNKGTTVALAYFSYFKPPHVSTAALSDEEYIIKGKTTDAWEFVNHSHLVRLKVRFFYHRIIFSQRWRIYCIFNTMIRSFHHGSLSYIHVGLTTSQYIACF